MSVTDHSDLVPRRRAGDESAPAPQGEPGEAIARAALDERPRTATGHCCDGRPCDHPGHDPRDGGGGVIHFIF
jgi:hypothetical protein